MELLERLEPDIQEEPREGNDSYARPAYLAQRSRKLGQLMTVDNVHWDLELSTLTEIINERSKTRPAILFDRIKGYLGGYRVAANLVSSTERLALTLGMEAGFERHRINSGLASPDKKNRSYHG
jgi:UbiD family decarboxylase